MRRVGYSMGARIGGAPPLPAGSVDVWLDREQADVARECDEILAERGLPDEVMNALLSDMAVVAGRIGSWSCSTRRHYCLSPCGRCDFCIRHKQGAKP